MDGDQGGLPAPTDIDPGRQTVEHYEAPHADSLGSGADSIDGELRKDRSAIPRYYSPNHQTMDGDEDSGAAHTALDGGGKAVYCYKSSCTAHTAVLATVQGIVGGKGALTNPASLDPGLAEVNLHEGDLPDPDPKGSRTDRKHIPCRHRAVSGRLIADCQDVHGCSDPLTDPDATNPGSVLWDVPKIHPTILGRPCQ